MNTKEYMYKVRENGLVFILGIPFLVITAICCIPPIEDVANGVEISIIQTMLPIVIFASPALALFLCYFGKTLYVLSEREEYYFKSLWGSNKHFYYKDIIKIEVKRRKAFFFDSDEVVVLGYNNKRERLFRINSAMYNFGRLMEELYGDEIETNPYYDYASFDELVEQALDEIKTYLHYGRTIPFYTNRRQLETIRFELLKILQIRDPNLFMPSFEKYVREEWDSRNVLRHDLLDIWVTYRQMAASILPDGVSPANFARAKFVFSEICKEKDIECGNEVLSELTVKILGMIAENGDKCSSETYRKYGNKFITDDLRSTKDNIIHIEMNKGK